MAHTYDDYKGLKVFAPENDLGDGAQGYQDNMKAIADDLEAQDTAIAAKANSTDLTTHTSNTTDAHDLTNRLTAKADASALSSHTSNTTDAHDLTTRLAAKADATDLTTHTANTTDAHNLTVRLAAKADATDLTTHTALTTTAHGGIVPSARTITTTAPLTIGGGASADLSGDRTLAISAATSGSAGSMSATDKAKLDASTDTATNSAIVARNSSGGFSAGAITATALKTNVITTPTTVSSGTILDLQNNGTSYWKFDDNGGVFRNYLNASQRVEFYPTSNSSTGVGRIDFHGDTTWFRATYTYVDTNFIVLYDTSVPGSVNGGGQSKRISIQCRTWTTGGSAGLNYAALVASYNSGTAGSMRYGYVARPYDGHSNGNEYEYFSIHNGPDASGIAGGKVGICTTSPSATLDVVGDMKCSKRLRTGVSALTDAANIATDTSLGNTFTVTLGDNRTMSAPTGSPANGDKIMYRIRQDGTGNRTITWNSAFRFSGDPTPPTLSTAANKTDYVGFIYNSTDSKWDCIAERIGF